MTMRLSSQGYLKAQQIRDDAALWWSLVEQRDRLELERNFAAEDALYDRFVPMGIYRHWKDSWKEPKFYGVAGVELDITTPTQLRPPRVVYYSLYGRCAGRPVGRDLIHLKNGFLTPVDRPDWPYTGPRFRLYRRLSSGQLSHVREHAKWLAKIKTRTGFIAALKAVIEEVHRF